MKSLVAILILAAAFLVGACNSSSSSTGPSVAPATTETPSEAAPSVDTGGASASPS
ncbi:MAG: hypothetical protein ACJ78L_03945 [Chloroflexota bacterium]